MSGRVQVSADLSFEVDLLDGRRAAGRLTGSGRRLSLEVDRPEVFAGRADIPALAALADQLAARSLVVDVVQAGADRAEKRRHPDVLLTVGAVLAPWWQRRLTGSRHIRLGGWRGLLAPGRARLRLARRLEGGPVLPGGGLLPPPTPYPVAPTFARRLRRRAGTTHDPARGGQPRLVLVARDAYLPGERQPIYWLGEVARIGSAPDCQVRLPGLRPLHAEVLHDGQDEFVVIAHDPDTRVHGAPVIRSALRTGARLDVGPWTLAFAREEYADHGRPHGGRIGGELGHQRPQPPRESMEADRRG